MCKRSIRESVFIKKQEQSVEQHTFVKHSWGNREQWHRHTLGQYFCEGNFSLNCKCVGLYDLHSSSHTDVLRKIDLLLTTVWPPLDVYSLAESQFENTSFPGLPDTQFTVPCMLLLMARAMIFKNFLFFCQDSWLIKQLLAQKDRPRFVLYMDFFREYVWTGENIKNKTLNTWASDSRTWVTPSCTNWSLSLYSIKSCFFFAFFFSSFFFVSSFNSIKKGNYNKHKMTCSFSSASLQWFLETAKERARNALG